GNGQGDSRAQARLSVLCQEEWGARRGVEQVTMRRGFGESISLPRPVSLAIAGEVFAQHPFQIVTLLNLHTRTVWEQPFGAVEATVSGDVPVWGHWPATLFPNKAPETTVRYPNSRAAMADLSARAAGNLLAAFRLVPLLQRYE